MVKCRLLLSILFLSFLIVNTAHALDLELSVQTSTPEPGGDIVIDVDISNRVEGGSSISPGAKTGLVVKFIESYPFSLTRKSENIRQPFELCNGCTKKGTFYLYVDPNARSLLYPLVFELVDKSTVVRKEIFLEVKGFPDIIFDTTYDAKELKPGDQFNLGLKLTNVGTGIAKNIKVSQDSTDFIMAGDNLIFLDDLEPKKSTELDLTFIINENINPGSYLLPLEISVQDGNRNLYNFTQTIGLKILHKADLNIRNLKISSDDNKLYDIQFRVENVGKGDAKDVVAELLTDSEGFKKNYVGKLGPDEDLPIIFTIKLDGGKKQNIPLVITYIDDFGESSIQEDLEFELDRQSIFSTILILVVAIFAILIGIFIYLKKNYYI